MRLQPPSGFRGIWRTDDDARAVYSEAAGIARARPRGVAAPLDAEDAARLLRWSRDAGVPVIPRGSGSSMAGGAVGDGIVVDLSRLRELGAPDVTSRSIRAGAGVLRGEIERRAGSVGLTFPVDPSSGEFCTVGGMTATNAAGPHSLRHGAIRPWVLALECVFEDGTRETIRRGSPTPAGVPALARFGAVRDALVARAGTAPQRAVLKNSSGYATDAFARSGDLVDLLVGSEGTLAIFTAVELALTVRAAARAGVLAAFAVLEGAADAAADARAHGASACELLDRTFLTIAARGGAPFPVARDVEAVLLIEVESGDAAGAAATAEALGRGLRARHGAEIVRSDDARREAELWSFRQLASPAIARLDPSLRSMQFIEDAAVPPASLSAYVRGVREILQRADTDGVIFGHAGDAHVHVNPLVDLGRGGWRETVERILLDTTDLVARLGGTASGEHGDGRLRTPLLDRTWSAEERETFAAVKRAFDPDSRLNPGVKVPVSGQRAIDVVKYDPGNPALPPTARAAMEWVELERAYSRFRLDLV